jgi:hypothetical protein
MRGCKTFSTLCYSSSEGFITTLSEWLRWEHVHLTASVLSSALQETTLHGGGLHCHSALKDAKNGCAGTLRHTKEFTAQTFHVR